MRRFLLSLCCVLVLPGIELAQTGLKVPLQLTQIPGITSSWAGEGTAGCSAGVIDNRSSVSRQNNYHSLQLSSATGTWSAAINYSDTSCSGPWSSFGSTATMSQASNPSVAFGNGYHLWVQIVVTGNAVVQYAGQNQMGLSTATGSISFPISIAQGGTNATTAAAALANLLNGNAQGTYTNKVQMAGTNSGVSGASLCNDASGNATTAGCTSLLPTATSQLQYLQIQPNTGNNSTLQWTFKQYEIMTDYYSFAANSVYQAPPDNISPLLRTITLSPVPLGVNATDTAHYIGIFNNSGTWQENCLINGGTATAGASSGTITCSSLSGTYATGSYKVGSATYGLAEAIITAGSSGSVFIPAGVWPVYAPTSVPASYLNFSLFGAGPQTSILSNQSTTTDVIDWPSTAGYVRMSRFGVAGQSNATAGWAFHVGGSLFGQIDHLWVHFGYNGMYLANLNSWLVDSLYGYGLNNIGMQLDATNGNVTASSYSNLFFFTTYNNSDTGGLLLTTQTGGTMAGPIFSNSVFIGGNAGVLAEPAAGTNMNEVVFVGGNITGSTYGLHVIAHGATAYNWRVEGLQYLATIGTGGQAGPAISIDDGAKQFVFSDNPIQCGGAFECVDIRGSSMVTLTNNDIGGGTADMVDIEPGNGTNATFIKFSHNNIGYAKNVTYGTTGIHTTADAHSNIYIGPDNRIYGSTAALNIAATGSGNRIDKPWIDPTSGAYGQPTCGAGFVGSTFFIPGGSGVADLSETCVKSGSGAYEWDRNTDKTMGSAIASASTITLTDPVHHITGTATLQTINVPPGFSPGNQIVLISDGGFGWNNAGNIKKPAAQSPAATNGVVIFTWDGTNLY